MAMISSAVISERMPPRAWIDAIARSIRSRAEIPTVPETFSITTVPGSRGTHIHPIARLDADLVTHLFRERDLSLDSDCGAHASLGNTNE